MTMYNFRSSVNFNDKQNLDIDDDVKDEYICDDDLEILSGIFGEMKRDFMTDDYFDERFLEILTDLKFHFERVKADDNKNKERGRGRGRGRIVLSIDINCSRSLRRNERICLRSTIWEYLQDINDTYYLHDEISGNNQYMSFGKIHK